jgi:hypothetical protein
MPDLLVTLRPCSRIVPEIYYGYLVCQFLVSMSRYSRLNHLLYDAHLEWRDFPVVSYTESIFRNRFEFSSFQRIEGAHTFELQTSLARQMQLPTSTRLKRSCKLLLKL